jgi:hypothetical protein
LTGPTLLEMSGYATYREPRSESALFRPVLWNV